MHAQAGAARAQNNAAPPFFANRVDIVGDSPLPNLGPLVAMAFDKAVTIIVGQWKVLLIVVVLSTAGGFYGVSFALLPSIAFAVYWAIACYAHAVRLERPEYRMRARRAITLVGLYIGTGLLFELGILLLVVPGVYFGTKYSMASIVAVTDDVGVNASGSRSWALTTNVFWPTLGFNVALYLAMMALSVVGYIIGLVVIGGLAQLLIASGGMHPPAANGDLTGLFGALVGFFFCIYVIAISVAYQAHAVAQLYWLRALERRADAAAVAVSAPTFS
jgi:hypothetical protein